MWELDFLRGAAVVSMLVYHLLFDLYYFAGLGETPFQGLGDWGAWLTAATFLSLLGLSLTLAESRRNRNVFFQLRRVLLLLALASLFTIVSSWLAPGRTIYFGVLHLIAVSLLLALPFRKRPFLALVSAIVVWSLQPWISSLRSRGLAWLWLGIMPYSYQTLDYYPLVPWFGFVLLGIGLGGFFFPSGEPAYRKLWRPGTPSWLRAPVWLGRHSLLIFLIHHPLLIGLARTIGYLR